MANQTNRAQGNNVSTRHPDIKIAHMAYTLARCQFIYADACEKGEDRAIAEERLIGFLVNIQTEQ